MKSIIQTIIMFIIVQSTIAQNNVGIGTNTPNASAKLDINASDKGVLFPNVALTSANAAAPLTSPATGLIVWNTGTGGLSPAGFYYNSGSSATPAWTKVAAGAVLTTTLNDGKIWIGNASNIATEQTLSGDVAISNTGVATIQDNSVDGTDIALASNANGDLMYYNGTDWVRLAPGTAGQVLQTNGAAAPTWVNGTKNDKAQNGVNIAVTAPNATATDAYIELGGALVRPTTISGLTATNKMSFTGTGVDAFNIDGTTFSVDATNDRIGLGIAAPVQKLDVRGNINLPNAAGNFSIYTWDGADANWRIGMNNTDANVGFARSLATSHVQYATYASGAGQGFAVGDKVTGLSSFEVTGSGSGYNAYFRGGVGIGVNPSHKLTIAGTGQVLGVDNRAEFAAKNSAGSYETFFWPRFSDNVMYMNFGSGGLNLRNNSSVTALFIDNDLSIDIKRGVLFNCNDCGSSTTIDGSADWGDLIIQGRVLSTNSNLHLSPPSGSKVIINTAYRSAGGTMGTTGLDIEDGGIRMKKTYRHYQNYVYCNCYGAGGWGPNSLGNWDFCALSQVGFKNNYSVTDEDDDVQCAVYPSNSGYGETSVYDANFSHAYNSRPQWNMYFEAYEDTRGVTCAANCINFE